MTRLANHAARRGVVRRHIAWLSCAARRSGYPIDRSGGQYLRPGSLGERIEFSEILIGQSDRRGRGVLLDVPDATGAGDRHDVLTLC